MPSGERATAVTLPSCFLSCFDSLPVRRSQSQRLRRRQRWYFAVMGVCLVLIVLAWNLVRLWSTTTAVAMSVVAALLPPIAVVIANWGEDR